MDLEQHKLSITSSLNRGIVLPHKLVPSLQRLVDIGNSIMIGMVEVQALTNLTEVGHGLRGKMDKGIAICLGIVALGLGRLCEGAIGLCSVLLSDSRF